MGKYIAENIIKMLIKANKKIKGSRVAIMGITFKENCPDVRNTKVIDIINNLTEYGIDVIVCDPVANADEVWKEYKIKLYNTEDIKNIDAIAFCVSHKVFNTISLKSIGEMHNNQRTILIDIKGMFNRQDVENMDFLYWSL